MEQLIVQATSVIMGLTGVMSIVLLGAIIYCWRREVRFARSRARVWYN